MHRIPAALAIAVVLVGCSGEPDLSTAQIMCEEFIEGRVGSDLEFGGASDRGGEQVGDLRWEATGTFTEPADGSTTSYTCEVEHDGDETWTLVDIETDR